MDYLASKKREIEITPEELIQFEEDVKIAFENSQIRAPIHLTRGNEKELISIFKYIAADDWVFSTWRSHYHALLHGIDKTWLMNEILQGRSITVHSKEHNFFTSAIVGGTLPIAIGAAMALKRQESKNYVWIFVGDMTAESGIFYEALKYATRNNLPILFVVEDNGMSTNTPTQESWGGGVTDATITLKQLTGDVTNCHYPNLSPSILRFGKHVLYYKHERQFPHTGIGKWVYF